MERKSCALHFAILTSAWAEPKGLWWMRRASFATMVTR